jgi:regulatory protein
MLAAMRSRRPPQSEPIEDAGTARAMALRWLGRRELSESQLRARLDEKGVTAPVIDTVVTALREAGVVDDRRVALAVARTRAQVRRQGRDRVRRELTALGIARDVVDDALAATFSDVDESALLDQAITRRLRGRVSLADPADRRRITAALIRQGFSFAAISRALRARRHDTRE